MSRPVLGCLLANGGASASSYAVLGRASGSGVGALLALLGRACAGMTGG